MRPRIAGLLISTTLAAVIAGAALRTDAILTSVMVVATIGLIARAARRCIGGVTGDVFGASVELTETVVLLSGVVLTDRA